MTETHCEYCGTMIDEDGTEESNIAAAGPRITHFASTCRERAVCGLRARVAAAEADAAKVRADMREWWTRISKIVVPGAKRHPAYDSATLHSEVGCLRDSYDEMTEMVERLRAVAKCAADMAFDYGPSALDRALAALQPGDLES